VTTELLDTLLGCSPRFCTVAVEGNITAGLIGVLHILGLRPHSLPKACSDVSSAVDASLECLCELMEYDQDNQGGGTKAALDAGIIPVLCGLLAVCDEQRIERVLALSAFLLRVKAPGHEGEWAGRLPHAIARLLNASLPVAAAQAADTLFNMCSTHPQLLQECHTWGLGDSLGRLTAHSDPEMAAAAKKLLSVAENWLDVSFPLSCCPLAILLYTAFPLMCHGRRLLP
jgi:hypothetical protein